MLPPRRFQVRGRLPLQAVVGQEVDADAEAQRRRDARAPPHLAGQGYWPGLPSIFKVPATSEDNYWVPA